LKIFRELIINCLTFKIVAMKLISFRIILVFCVLVFQSCSDNDTNTSTTSNTTNNNPPKDTIIKKSDTAILIETVGDLAKKALEQKRRKDSTMSASKGEHWVYQIGDAFDKQQLVGEEYEKLKSLNNIYVFRKPRNKYYLIKDEGFYSETQAADSLPNFKSRLAKLSTAQATKIDLSQECSSRKLPTNSDRVKYKHGGEKLEVDCKTCE
jgi:hypothetical protein